MFKIFKGFWVLLAVILVLSNFGSVVRAQALSTIRGTVTDASGAVVPGVEIAVIEADTNVRVRVVLSDDSGNYEVPDVQRGRFRIRAELPGFKTFVADNVVVEANQIRRVNIRLEVGETAEELTVESGFAAITTDSAEIQSLFTTKQVDISPLMTRTQRPHGLLTLMPGIDNQGGGWGYRIAGQPGSQVSQAMDGTSRDGVVQQVAVVFAFEEYQVAAVNAKADEARVVAFNMISKRGQNDFRGSLHYTHSNSALWARDFFAPRKPVHIEHQTVVEMSGPIVRDRTFFYASWFDHRFPGGSFRRATVPTALMRGGDFSQWATPIRDPLTGEPFPNQQIPTDRINPMAQRMQGLYIAPPNLGGPDQLTNNLGWEHPYPVSIWKGSFPVLRIDHQISEKNSIYGRYASRNNRYILSRSMPGFAWTRDRTNHATAFSNTHVFSPAVVHTFQMSWWWDYILDGVELDGFKPLQGDEAVAAIGLQGVNPKGLSAMGFPTVNITGMASLNAAAGAVGNGPSEDNHVFTVADSLTWATGRHVFKFGGDGKRLPLLTAAVPGANWGTFAFNGSMSGIPYGDFLLGLPSSSQRLDPLIPRTRTAKEFGLYVMDTFKMTPALTLDLGIRWDFFTTPRYEDGLEYNWDPRTGDVIIPAAAMASISPLYPATINVVAGDPRPSASRSNFRPRLGVAYRLGDLTVIRGGYGQFTEQIGAFSRVGGAGPFQIAETYSPNRIVDGQPRWAFPNPFPADIATAAIPSQSVAGFPLQTRHGIIHQFNLTVEREVRGLGVRTSYIGSRSRGLNYNLNINKPEPSLTPFAQSRRPYPQYIGASFIQDNGASNYNSLQFQVSKKAGIFTFDTHYTLQSNRSNFLNLENPYNPNQWNREQYASRHKFVVSTIIELPWGRGRRFLADAPGVVDHILGGWQLATVSHLQSGHFFSPSFSGRDPSNTNTVGGTPDQICDGNLPSSQRRVEGWFDPSCFTVPEPGRFGNAGVNILEGPGLHLHHMTVQKRFTLTERFSVEYMASTSNLFNKPHFVFPRSNISAANPGVITGNRTGTDNAKANPRMVEMSLRLRW